MVWSAILAVMWLSSLWMIGNKSPLGYVVGAVANILWAPYLILTEQWGFVPVAAIYVAIHTRNYLSWRKEANGVSSENVELIFPVSEVSQRDSWATHDCVCYAGSR